MKRKIITISVILFVVVLLAVLKYVPGISTVVWNLSQQGLWILPLILVSSILDSVHPCSFSILLITVAFLFGLQVTRKKILQIGGVYIVGIFSSYILIGLGILKVFHFFNTPHFMGKIGAGLLITFGILNILSEIFPKFPIKLKIPNFSHGTLANLMEKASVPAAFILGLLVGICQFPCMGGPYFMIIGLLHDQVTYMSGFGYLALYNLIMILPLSAVLYVVSNKTVVDKVQDWRTKNLKGFKFWAGLAMVVIGILVLFI